MINNYISNKETNEKYFLAKDQYDLIKLVDTYNKDNDKTKEFINEIQTDSPSTEMHDGSVTAFYLKKGRNTSKGKTKDEVWMHPYLFIDFAIIMF